MIVRHQEKRRENRHRDTRIMVSAGRLSQLFYERHIPKLLWHRAFVVMADGVFTAEVYLG